MHYCALDGIHNILFTYLHIELLLLNSKLLASISPRKRSSLPAPAPADNAVQWFMVFSCLLLTYLGITGKTKTNSLERILEQFRLDRYLSMIHSATKHSPQPSYEYMIE